MSSSFWQRTEFPSWLGFLVLLLFPLSLLAQAPRNEEGTWEHSDGMWWGWQRTNPDPAGQSLYLVDDGSLQLSRAAGGRSDLTRLNWTLGLGRSLDRFVILQGQSIWERTVGKHRLSLGLDTGGSVFWGSTRFANLEDQFLLSSGIDFAENEGRTDRWGSGINLADSIAVTRTLDLTVDLTHQESRSEVNDQEQSRSQIDSWGARLEQRWVRAGLQASVRKTELDLRNGLSGAALNSEQNLVDIQARLLFPIVGRFNGTAGWQDLSSQSTGVADRRLSGPELGFIYNPFASWSSNVFLRALREQGNEDTEGQLFGEANIAWRSDVSNSFIFNANKQIDLLTSYRVFTVQNLVATDQQRNTVSTQVQWLHQRGRYRQNLSVQQSRQEFAQSLSHFNELSVIQTYNVTRLAEVSVGVSGRSSQFKTDAPPVENQRSFGEVRMSWQETLTGGIRPFGGRSFYRFDLSYENLQEQIIDIRAERLTFLASFGQMGNF